MIIGAAQEPAATDWHAMDAALAHRDNAYPAAPAGDLFAAANAVRALLQAA
ncbi:MAG: hypothetical protein JF587_18040 [Catenulisporales bacterium]|nr:hypothetical protein [Catenulisporales bacterium]